MRVAILASLCALSLVSPAMARAQALPRSGNAQVDALLTDLADGNRNAAIGRISDIESFNGEPRLAATASAFVDRLAGCTATSVSPTHLPTMVKIEWACRNGRYASRIDWKVNNPYLVVIDFEDEAMMARVAQRRLLSPPLAPPRPDLSRRVASPMADLNIMNAMALSIVDGSYKTKSAVISVNARVTLGRRDPVSRVTVNQLDGEGPEAFVAQTGGALKLTGHPKAVSCETGEVVGWCRFSFAGSDHVLVAAITTRDGKVSGLQYIYGTPTQAPRDTGKVN